jgi:hypothetical protein
MMYMGLVLLETCGNVNRVDKQARLDSIIGTTMAKLSARSIVHINTVENISRKVRAGSPEMDRTSLIEALALLAHGASPPRISV